jgi:hypothetical protein
MITRAEAIPRFSIDHAPVRHALRTPVLVAAAVLAAAVAKLALIRARRQPAEPGGRFRTARVAAGPLEARVTATGTLSALVTVQVGSQARIDPRLFVHASRHHAVLLPNAALRFDLAAAEASGAGGAGCVF